VGALLDRESGRVLTARLVRAAGLMARTIGLLGRSDLGDDQGMYFDRCHAVHTLGMRVPIDVLFLDASGAVVAIASSVPPWRAVVSAKGARSVVELPAGFCARTGIRVGDVLALEWP
jgi:uncharacterized membrane protein (UPF0127 family)